ncbi:hypothetical protein [Gynuella sunshinyii]|uniref:Uncharacterized protein n=1 Tax=Gynuella sunshinyii YC6258 TaxID=1445510 RepID=A0A0C5W2H5_9GAMM|nr:hypothetical protein [Gynuella sunshinyii]AJQ96879.1 hypothetical Protein YC6258_04847 [Gynuella sunshinyii YC6258]
MIKRVSNTYLISNVPDHIIDNPHFVKAGQSYLSHYNVAVWLNMTQAHEMPMRLVLKIQDDVKEQTIKVDEVQMTRIGQTLLSGVAVIKSKGPIRQMQLHVKTENNHLSFQIDEIFVQRHEQKQQLTSASERRNSGR